MLENAAESPRGVGQHFFGYFLNLHTLVDEWNQESHFALIIGILLTEFSNQEFFLHTSFLPKRNYCENEAKKTSER